MTRIFTKSAFPRMTAIAFAAVMMSAPVAQAQSDAVTILNDGYHDIHFVHITPIEWDDWGDDLLGYDAIVPPGESAEIDLALYGGACVYDVLVTFDTPLGLEEVALWEANLCESDFIAADEWEVVALDAFDFFLS